MGKIIYYLTIIFILLYLGILNSATLDFALQPASTQTTTEWVQHAHNAQRTGWTSEVVSTPWRFSWLRTDVGIR